MAESLPADLERSLEAGDARAAAVQAAGLRGSPPGLREAFLRLLARRGYFVASPAEIRRSLEEIREIGPGFDLYDLAAAVAGCRVLPELLPLPGGAL